MNDVAKPGCVFVCCACGKRSMDRYGDQRIDRGWDESCMLNAQEFAISDLVFGDDGRVIEVRSNER